MIDNFIRLLIIIFSSLAVPFLVKLIIGLTGQKTKRVKDIKTRYVLLGLFYVLLGAALLSIYISSLGSIDQYTGFININIGGVSRVRSLLFSASNLIVSVIFHQIYCDGR